MAEFTALSSKIAGGSADEHQKGRWRELRVRLTGRAATDGAPPLTRKTRKDPRATAKLKVGYTPVSELSVTFADNISAGGLQLTVQRHIGVGELVLLHLDLDVSPVILLSRVVWSNREGGHFRVGVEFLALGAREREQIDAFVASVNRAQPAGG